MACWGPRGETLMVRIDPGRAHTSFYGTLNLATGNVVVTQVEKMNAQTTAQHLETILSAYPERKLLVLWDKAPWHNGPAVRTVLEANPRLSVLTFPTASPDLNPQEHVWRATRRKVAHNHAQRRLPDLAARFETYLKQTTFPSSFLEKYTYPVCPGFT